MARRARAATTTSGSGSTRTTRTSSCSRGDQGAIVTVNGGADVELLVQPANGAVLPREHGQRVSLPRLRRPAGERIGVRREPGRRADRSRCATGTPVGAEEYGYIAPDPNDPDIVYGGKLTRYDRRTGQAQDVMPPRGAELPRAAHGAGALLADRARHAVLRREHVVEDHERRAAAGRQISPDLSRGTLGGAGDRRRLSRHAGGHAHPARRDLHGRAVVHRSAA